jgi:hypothetical protein
MNSKTILWTAVFMLGFSFMSAGCAAMKRKEAAGTEDILIAAGFTSKVPGTPEAWARFENLKPLKLIQTKKDGEVIYVYPDPYNCKCAYVGNEKQYAEYKRLALQKKIAEENLQAARMWDAGPPYGPPYDGYWWW